MAYSYHISFDIDPEQKAELEIGASLERVIGYLRTLLPSEDGHIESRALASLDDPKRIHIVFESIWMDWDSLVRHRNSTLTEDKVIKEFKPDVELKYLTHKIFREIS